MKIFIFLVFCSILSAHAFAQQEEHLQNMNSTQLHDQYVKKQKTNLLAGWILVGTGTALTAAGILVNLSSPWTAEHNNDGLWMCYIGAGELLVSIPVFVMAGVNKRKARLALKNEHVVVFPGNKHNFTALALQVHL